MLSVGQAAPDFTLPDADGRARHLAEALSEGPAVLAFLKADCAACNLAFPYLERMRATHSGGGWTLWGISQHPARAARWFAGNTGVTFPLLIDDDGFPVSRAYDPEATPTIFLVDRDGTVRTCHVGMAKAQLNELAAQVAGLIGQAPTVVAPDDDGKPSVRPG